MACRYGIKYNYLHHMFKNDGDNFCMMEIFCEYVGDMEILLRRENLNSK